MGIRVGSWFRPPHLADIEPTNRYPGEVAAWLGEGDYSVAAVAEAYAQYALRIVQARR
jgi:hypothetical protein